MKKERNMDDYNKEEEYESLPPRFGLHKEAVFLSKTGDHKEKRGNLKEKKAAKLTERFETRIAYLQANELDSAITSETKRYNGKTAGKSQEVFDSKKRRRQSAYEKAQEIEKEKVLKEIEETWGQEQGEFFSLDEANKAQEKDDFEIEEEKQIAEEIAKHDAEYEKWYNDQKSLDDGKGGK
jgi:hypothetical protein